MSKPIQTPAPALKTWARPELVRLGKIADVAQQGPGLPQGGNKS